MKLWPTSVVANLPGDESFRGRKVFVANRPDGLGVFLHP